MKTKEKHSGTFVGGNSKLSENKKYLSMITVIMLYVLSTATFINLLTMYWFPKLFLFSSFSAVQIAFIALIEKRYYLLVLSVLICALLVITTVSIRRHHIFFPIASLVYLVLDHVNVCVLLIDGLRNDYWEQYIFQWLFSLVLIVGICVFCWEHIRKLSSSRRNTGDGPMC